MNARYFALSASLSPFTASESRNAQQRGRKRDFVPSESVDVVEFERFLQDASATRALGAALAKASMPGFVILLNGPLGAGKTTFVQGFVAAIGGDAAASPSFVVAHYYAGAPIPIWHLDLYRMEDRSEIEDLDLVQYLPADGVALVEWANRAPDIWPRDRIEIEVSIEGAARRATVRGSGLAAAKLRQSAARDARTG
jgi:tRNA threonylcarbamoyladenosine biosynthesis protein TsaE